MSKPKTTVGSDDSCQRSGQFLCNNNSNVRKWDKRGKEGASCALKEGVIKYARERDEIDRGSGLSPAWHRKNVLLHFIHTSVPARGISHAFTILAPLSVMQP